MTFIVVPTKHLGTYVQDGRSDCLSLSSGDIISILDRTNCDEWHGVNETTGKKGWFPSKFVTLVHSKVKDPL